MLGFYCCRGQTTDEVLGWAEDFPGEAIGTLTRLRGAKGRRTSRLPAGLLTEVPEWADFHRACRSEVVSPGHVERDVPQRPVIVVRGRPPFEGTTDNPRASRHQAARRASSVSRTLLRCVIASCLDVVADGRRRR